MSAEAYELKLFMDNDYATYRQKQAFVDNVKKKIAKGKYDPALAVKLWTYYADRGAKAYAKDNRMTRMFSPAVRRAVAAEYARETEQELGWKRGRR